MKGRHHTEESNQKNSEAHKGRIGWNKGIPRTKEEKIKISIGNKGKKHTDEWKKKLSERMKGNKHSLGVKQTKETRQKQSISQKARVLRGLHHFYKGGIYPMNNSIRKSIEYKLWREAIFKRDDFKCKKCIDGGYLHPHHILNFSSHVELRFAIDNGVTLCYSCHMKFHNRYGRMNNTQEQLREFLQ